MRVCRCRISAAARIPSSVFVGGMRMSTIATSGSVDATRSSRSSAVPACPTTSKPSSSRIARDPLAQQHRVVGQRDARHVAARSASRGAAGSRRAAPRRRCGRAASRTGCRGGRARRGRGSPRPGSHPPRRAPVGGEDLASVRRLRHARRVVHREPDVAVAGDVRRGPCGAPCAPAAAPATPPRASARWLRPPPRRRPPQT